MVQLARVALELQDAGDYQKIEAAKVGGLEPDMAGSACVAVLHTKYFEHVASRNALLYDIALPAVDSLLLWMSFTRTHQAHLCDACLSFVRASEYRCSSWNSTRVVSSMQQYLPPAAHDRPGWT